MMDSAFRADAGTLLALRAAIYVLVYVGLFVLYVGDLMGSVVVGIAAVAVALSWSAPPSLARLVESRRVGPVIVGLAIGASALDLLYLSQSVLDGLARLLLFLLLYRLFTRHKLRDFRDVAFLSFFMLVVVSPATSGIAFLFAFVVFLVMGTWALMLYHVLTETERAAATVLGHAKRARLGRDLFGLSVAASVATMVITIGLFFIIPRVGQAAMPLRAQLARKVSGFSDRVELGSFGEIETDATVVMRVHFAESVAAPDQLPNLRWRGIVFDQFDGRAWKVGRPERVTLKRMTSAPFAPLYQISPYRGPGPIVVQEVYLEPIGTDVVFGAPRVLRLGLRSDSVVVDDMGSFTVSTAAARLQYTVESELEIDGRHFNAGGWSRPFDLAERARYLQLPPMSPRVEALAREVTAGATDAHEAASRLSDHLSRNFRYTLALERQTSLDPVEEFLFVRRSGNCEYFAAALAVMLRTIGIPARVVGGFQRGDWNPYGRYFMVRLSDAHSWVEAHTGGGWTTLDPSPRAAASALRGMLGLYLDALRMRWYRYVVNWSIQDQVLAALKARQVASSWASWRPAAMDWSRLRPLALPAVVVVVGFATVMLWRRARPSGATRPGARLPPFYARALRALARRGLSPGAGETAREFCRRAEREDPIAAPPLARLTFAYERVRFGSAALEPAEATEVEACVRALEGGRRANGGS